MADKGRTSRSGQVPSTRCEGFTLIEILVTLAVVTALIALGLFISMDVYRGFLHRSERDTVVSLLQRARSHAMANIGQSPWGFCKDAGGSYVVFRGASYAPDEVETSVAASGAPAITGMPQCGSPPGPPPNEIVFTQLSGTTTSGIPDITIKQGAAPADTITINDQGTIIW